MKQTLKNTVIACGTLIFLTACGASNNAEWEPRYVAPEANVVMAHDEVVLDFVAGTCTPYLSSKETVVRSLEDIRPDQVTNIDIYAHNKNQANRAKEMIKLAGLKENLKTHMVQADMFDENKAIIHVSHWDARVDDCPNWNKPSGTDYNNSMGSSFGCATAQNLAAMIVNPHDLKAGKKASPADAHQGVGAIERYRTGEIIDIDREGILSQ